MSNADDFIAKKESIMAISDDLTLEPNMPVSIYLQEAENLGQWCQEDKPELTGVGLDWNWVEEFPIRTGALREAESYWFKERYGREEAENDWAEKGPKAETLRDDLLSGLRYAFRKDSSLMNRVREIADGAGHPDMIQDLNDISMLGKANTDKLTVIRFDLEQLDHAAATSKEMAELLAKVNGDREENNSHKIIRDKAYTYLKEAVDEVRDCGKYVFKKNDNRLKGYSSNFFRKSRKK